MQDYNDNLVDFFNHAVNILIGGNGSGKSELLNELSLRYIRGGGEVIAIATSVHDKFTSRSERFHFLGGRQGKNIVAKTIKNSIRYMSNGHRNSAAHLLRALSYTGFQSEIRLIVVGLDISRVDEVLGGVDTPELYGAISFLKYFTDVLRSPESVMIDLAGFESNTMQQTTFRDLVDNESVLKRLKIIKRLDLELMRDGLRIPLLKASSGELMVLSGLVHISTYIDEGVAILIDEPENSLHPRWQQEYVRNILDLFQYYRPLVVIATHSPLIIPLGTEDAVVYGMRDRLPVEIDRSSSNNEEILADVFGVVTPENRFLSDEMVRVINLLDEKKIGLEKALAIVEDYKFKSYDPRVIRFLEGVADLMNQTASV